MLWACLRFPQLAFDALRAVSATASAALAVSDGPAQQRRIVFANSAARSAGVHAGQNPATAHALCPQLQLLARDVAAEQQALQTFATLASRYSSLIHLREPAAVLLEVGASLNLFGGWPALQRRLREEVARSGFACRIAAAPTASAAQVLADADDGIALTTLAVLQGALAQLPLAQGGLEPGTVAALHGMGLRTLGQLFRLPRAELARRIGAPALAHLDRLRGRIAEAWPRWQPPARFVRRLEFEAAVHAATMLAFPLQRLLRELELFLIARDGGVQRFTLVLGHERGASTRIPVGLLAPQRDAARLLELARVRLERSALPAPAWSLTLQVDELPPLVPPHRELFDAREQGRLDWQALAERLRARLGEDALHGLACVADHRPARAWRHTPPDTAAPAARSESHPAPMRPFWLLQRPLALHHAPPRILTGPERIESGWWDGHDQRRDYYVVELRSGQRAWAFVEAGSHTHWTLHGWFA